MKKINYNNESIQSSRDLSYWVTQGITIEGKKYSIVEFDLREDGLYAILLNGSTYYEVLLLDNSKEQENNVIKEIVDVEFVDGLYKENNNVKFDIVWFSNKLRSIGEDLLKISLVDDTLYLDIRGVKEYVKREISQSKVELSNGVLTVGDNSFDLNQFSGGEVINGQGGTELTLILSPNPGFKEINVDFAHRDLMYFLFGNQLGTGLRLEPNGNDFKLSASGNQSLNVEYVNYSGDLKINDTTTNILPYYNMFIGVEIDSNDITLALQNSGGLDMLSGKITPNSIINTLFNNSTNLNDSHFEVTKDIDGNFKLNIKSDLTSNHKMTVTADTVTVTSRNMVSVEVYCPKDSWGYLELSYDGELEVYRIPLRKDVYNGPDTPIKNTMSAALIYDTNGEMTYSVGIIDDKIGTNNKLHITTTLYHTNPVISPTHKVNYSTNIGG